MKADIHLFIEDKEIEFNKDPQIVFNYKLSEITNPTAVKNSFSKSITIEGTPTNNDIFSNIWSIESYYNGYNFNHNKKTSFVIYINGSIYEQGYVKLDNVTTKNNNVEYSISLFGGLGQFIWNLAYADGEGNSKRTLADLSYATDYYSEPNLDFNITKETVWDAWNTLMGNPNAVYDEKDVNRPNNYLYDDKWQLFNFIPMCNGVPNDFDASKVMININGIPEGIIQSAKDGYLSVNGYTLGEASEDMTEWETRDLRSYLQRGAIKMDRIIEACCQPSNNGGYQVKLDNHFFNSTNPYYADAWVTTKMCSEMELENGTSTVVDNATLVKRGNTSYYDIRYDVPTLSKSTNMDMSMKITFMPDTASTADLYMSGVYEYDEKDGRGSIRRLAYKNDSGILIQLFAMDAADRIISYSKAYLLAEVNNSAFKENFYIYDGDYTFIQGKFKKNGLLYEFCDMNNNFISLNFSLIKAVEFDHLVLNIQTGCKEDSIYTQRKRFTKETKLFKTRNYYNKKSFDYDEAMSYLGLTNGLVDYPIVSFSVLVNDYEDLISGSKVTKDKLLASDKTPADYLLSYCKMFGLHIFQDPMEKADDTNLYPKGVIHIMDRNSFYKRDEIVDISKLIDYNKGVQMTPQMAGNKFYSFAVDQIDSDAAESYKSTYKNNFGEKIVNTNYEFDSSTKKLYDGNVFKAGIMVREKDKYFNHTRFSIDIPAYGYNGLTYSLYKGDDTLELEVTPKKLDSYPINIFGLDYYDNFPKLQAHSKDNESSDGSNVLMFYRGNIFTEGSQRMVDYWLTDDIAEMALLNDGAPCWIMTLSDKNDAGKTIAYKINQFPYFSRYITYGGQEGIITHSWDFGGSQTTYIPNTYNSDEMGIYDRCWKKYINDMYSINSRKLTCWVNLTEKPNVNWLRRFYWFSNSLWRINAIIDWNMSIDGLTKFEFIKVQDTANYALDKITTTGTMAIEFLTDSIDGNGGAMAGNVYMQDGGNWAFSDSVYAIDDEGNYYYYASDEICVPNRGSGITTPFVVNVPQNRTGKKLTWHISLAKWVWETTGGLVEGVFEQEPADISDLYFERDSTNVNVKYNEQSVVLDFIALNIDDSTIFTTSSGDGVKNIYIDKAKHTVTVNISENTGSAKRNMEITLKGTSNTGIEFETKATIIQNFNAYLTLSVNDYNFPSTGGELSVNIISNAEWEIVKFETIVWLGVEHTCPSSGSGDATFKVTCSKEETGSPKSGKIKLRLKEDPTVTAVLNLSQEAGVADWTVEYVVITNIMPYALIPSGFAYNLQANFINTEIDESRSKQGTRGMEDTAIINYIPFRKTFTSEESATEFIMRTNVELMMKADNTAPDSTYIYFVQYGGDTPISPKAAVNGDVPTGLSIRNNDEYLGWETDMENHKITVTLEAAVNSETLYALSEEDEEVLDTENNEE